VRAEQVGGDVAQPRPAADRRARVGEGRQPLEQAAAAPGIERRPEGRERLRALLVQRHPERAARAAQLGLEPRGLLAHELAQHVEVAYRADRAREPGEVTVGRGGKACGQEGGEQAQRRAQPAGRHPQLVDGLDLARPGGRLGAREGVQVIAHDGARRGRRAVVG